MSQVITEVLVDRPVEEVFAFVADPTNDPTWWRGVRQVRVPVAADAPAGIRAGAEYEQVIRLFGWRFTSRIRVAEYHPPRRAVLTTLDSATPFTSVYTFEPLAGGRTRFRMTATVASAGVYRLLGPLFLPLLRRQARIYFGVLKTVLESRP